MNKKHYLIRTITGSDCIVDNNMIVKVLPENKFWDCINDRKIVLTEDVIYSNDGFMGYLEFDAIEIDFAKRICGNDIDNYLDSILYFWEGNKWRFYTLDNDYTEKVSFIKEDYYKYEGVNITLTQWKDNFNNTYYTVWYPEYKTSIPAVIPETEYKKLVRKYTL